MSRLSLVALLAILVSGTVVATADAAVVTAEAGLGGLSRPGRWTPVRVSIDAGTASISGEIVVDWGSARARRTITLSAGSRKLVEIYIRTPDVRETIVVRLVSDGRDLAAVEVPIRLARPEDAFTLCVAAADAWSAGRECSTTQTAAQTAAFLARVRRGGRRRVAVGRRTARAGAAARPDAMAGDPCAGGVRPFTVRSRHSDVVGARRLGAARARGCGVLHPGHCRRRRWCSPACGPVR